MTHPYSGPASLDCVDEGMASERFQQHRHPTYNYSLPSGFSSSSHLSSRSLPPPSVISSSPTEHALSPIVEEHSSFFYDHDDDSDYPNDARTGASTRPTPSVRSRRLKKRQYPRPPPSARSEAFSDISHADTFRSGWTSSMMSDDTFDYLNDPCVPHWRMAIRRHLRRFRSFLRRSGSGNSPRQWTPGRRAALSVR